MKGLRKILSLAVAICTVASSLPVYAGQQTDSLGAIMYSGLTQAWGDECSALDGWTIDASGEGSSAIVSEEGMLVLTKEGASNARATFSTAIEGDVYVETKLSTTGSARFEVFSSKGTMTYTDFYVKDSCIYTNKGIEPDSHSNINVASYISGADVILGLYFSPSRDVFDVYVNGEKKAENLSMRMMADYEKLTAVRISSLDAPTTTNVDYVRAYTINKKENTAPAIADVKATGIASYGRKLKAEYTYSDAEGDREGETEYKWLISGTEGGTYTAIPGADRSTYAVGAEDGGKYIKLSVTPVDIFGNKGTEVVSAPVLVFAQKDTIYASTFDDKDTWTISDKGGEKYIAEITDNGEGEKYVRAGTTELGSYALMNKALNFTGSFTVEYDVKVPVLNGGSNRTYIARMSQKVNGKNVDLMSINYYDQVQGDATSGAIRAITSGGNKSAAANLSDWSKIRMDVNMTNKTMTLYVNGVTSTVWTNMPLGNAGCTATDPIVNFSLGMTAGNATNTADIRVKNFAIYQVKPYNTVPVAEDFIVRGVSAVGSTLYASYSYTDAEGDNETGSDIKWYMSESADGYYIEIEGVNTLAYKLPASLAGAYVKAVVTPKDYLGAVGEAVESNAFYVDYLTGDEIKLSAPRAVSAPTGTMTGEGNSYTFTASDATQNRWIWQFTPFSNPAVMSFKVKNPDASNARIALPNTEFGFFEFTNNSFSYGHLGGSATIAGTIDKNHTYDVKLVFAGFSGATTDYANLYVDGKFIGKFNSRKAVSSLSGVNIYTYAAGSLEISDFTVENIITEYPDFKVVSEDMFEPSNAGEPYEYSFVVKNASGKKKDFVAVLALYKTVDGVEVLESVDVYDEGLDLGETSVYLTVVPEDSEGTYTAQVIKLDSFKTLKPSEI